MHEEQPTPITPKHDMDVPPTSPGDPGSQPNQCLNLIDRIVSGPGTTSPAEQGNPGTEFPAGQIGPENVPEVE